MGLKTRSQIQVYILKQVIQGLYTKRHGLLIALMMKIYKSRFLFEYQETLLYPGIKPLHLYISVLQRDITKYDERDIIRNWLTPSWRLTSPKICSGDSEEAMCNSSLNAIRLGAQEEPIFLFRSEGGKKPMSQFQGN